MAATLVRASALLVPLSLPGSVCTTPASGQCSFGNLAFGSYFLVEEKAPTGYVLPAQTTYGPYVFDAATAGTVLQVTVKDPSVSVLGIKVVTSVPAVAPPVSVLPFTGARIGSESMVAMILLGTGILFTAFGYRRPRRVQGRHRAART